MLQQRHHINNEGIAASISKCVENPSMYRVFIILYIAYIDQQLIETVDSRTFGKPSTERRHDLGRKERASENLSWCSASTALLRRGFPVRPRFSKSASSGYASFREEGEAMP